MKCWKSNANAILSNSCRSRMEGSSDLGNGIYFFIPAPAAAISLRKSDFTLPAFAVVM